MNKISIMEASVRKWEKIIAGKGSDGGVLDCPPCRIFYILVCTGCPIAEYTGKRFCKGSPYPAWYWHQIQAHDKIIKKVYCPECLKLAENMRDFMARIVERLKNPPLGPSAGKSTPREERPRAAE
ncbi:MAG: hypothetical protein V1816_02590 [Pseudomonadota bacterium]